MDISSNTLMMVVQTLEEKVQGLAERMKTADDDELSDIEEELLDFSNARSEIKKVYTQMHDESDNLPSWQELVDELI
jgi:hypothetical protein